MDDRITEPGQKPGFATAHDGCWCLSKGLAGMVSQMSGLAQLLELDYQCLTTRLRFPWTMTPMAFIPRAPFVLRNAAQMRQPPPRVVISCGRHGVIPALWLKKTLGDRIFAAHIQDPHVDPSGFDLVIVPRHDNLRGRNVYLTTGAIHYVTPERLQAARCSPLVQSISDGRPTVAVLVGGANGNYAFSKDDLNLFVDRLHALTRNHAVRLVVLPSNRTAPQITTRLKEEFGADHFVWTGQTENPYFAALAIASHIVVTSDSVSMVTEAASTGLPVFVQQLTEKRASRRFRRFHQMFVNDGITRPFEGCLADWTYEPPNDTPKVAQIIRERIAQHESSERDSQNNYAA